MASDPIALPRYWPTIWLALDGAGLAHNTLRNRLVAIEGIYQCAIRLFGEDIFDRILTDVQFDQIDKVLTSRFVELRNDATQRSIDNTPTWRSAYGFVKATLDRLCSSETEIQSLQLLNTRLLKLDRQFRSLNPGPRRTKPMALRSLPSPVVADIYEIIHPNSGRNPYRNEALQWRNFCLILLLLHQGLRRGEALMLTVNSMRSGLSQTTGEQVFWLDVTASEQDDPRHQNRPSIKTRYSHRQIPVSDQIAKVWQNFVENYRGRQTHPYLFSNTWGNPMSGNAPGRILKTLSAALSPGALNALKVTNQIDVVRPHDLRHTCAVLRLSQFKDLGGTDDEIFEKLRAYFGWSYTSEMPRHYARAYFETRLASIWNDNFDATVEMFPVSPYGSKVSNCIREDFDFI